jgi:hypothetical protein
MSGIRRTRDRTKVANTCCAREAGEKALPWPRVIEEIRPVGDAWLLREGSAFLRTGTTIAVPAVLGEFETMRWM